MQTTGQQPRTPPAKQPSRRPPPPPPPPEFQAEKIMQLGNADLVKILNDPAATEFQKAKSCQKLASVGTSDAVAPLAALLTDPKLSHYARYGLEGIPDPSADEALRGALPKVKGALLVGVINSIGQRADARSAPVVARLLNDRDAAVAEAAAAALGSISGPEAAKALKGALAQTKGPVRTAVARACLVCSEGLLAKGARDEALALYDALTRPDIPKPIRLAAMRAIIAAETSLNRPR